MAERIKQRCRCASQEVTGFDLGMTGKATKGLAKATPYIRLRGFQPIGIAATAGVVRLLGAESLDWVDGGSAARRHIAG
jgi:ElaB/YqjD/DUF883 family membrane-anchored ribosome-binding protein